MQNPERVKADALVALQNVPFLVPKLLAFSEFRKAARCRFYARDANSDSLVTFCHLCDVLQRETTGRRRTFWLLTERYKRTTLVPAIRRLCVYIYQRHTRLYRLLLICVPSATCLSYPATPPRIRPA